MTIDHAIRCVAVFAVVLLLAGCGGSGSGGGTSSLRVEVSPTSQLLEVDAQHSFSAQVIGSADARVDWSVQTGDYTATYTAPGLPGTYHVVATSRADNTKTAVAEVRVYELPPPPP